MDSSKYNELLLTLGVLSLQYAGYLQGGCNYLSYLGHS